MKTIKDFPLCKRAGLRLIGDGVCLWAEEVEARLREAEKETLNYKMAEFKDAVDGLGYALAARFGIVRLANAFESLLRRLTPDNRSKCPGNTTPPSQKKSSVP